MMKVGGGVLGTLQPKEEGGVGLEQARKDG